MDGAFRANTPLLVVGLLVALLPRHQDRLIRHDGLLNTEATARLDRIRGESYAEVMPELSHAEA